MIELFVKKPAMTIVLVLVFVVLGLVSYSNLIIEETPKMDFPLVTVKTIYPGASPYEIETQIIKKIEDVVAEISEIKKIKSTAYENFALTIIEFDIKSDVNIKAIEVKDKVEAIVNELPDGAEKPEISKFDPLVKPIMDLVLIGSDSKELYEYADKKLKNKITTIEGVANVDLIGGTARQINVKLDANLMREYYITIDEVINAVALKNINIPAGALERTDNNINVRLIGEFQNIEDIKNLLIVSREGSIFKLSQIATIEDSTKKVETLSYYNGKESVGLSIKKLSDGDATSIAKKITKKLDDIRKELPKNMSLEIATDTTKTILADTNTTIFNIVYGIILTMLILYFVLGNSNSTIVASMVIPTSIVSAFFLMDFSKFSINMMTLLAIATALGTLIANALVVIESITNRVNSGENPEKAAIDGTKSVIIAVLASAGTNLVVFTPIAFMGGIIGKFMQHFGLTVVYLTLFSLIASFSLTPMLCAKLLKKEKKEKVGKLRLLMRKSHNKIDKFFDFLIKEYKLIFDYTLVNKKKILLATIILFIISIIPALYIGSEFFTPFDQNKITIRIKTPEGTTLEKTKESITLIEEQIKTIPEVLSFLSYIGVDGEENGEIKIELLAREKRKRTDMDIINKLIPNLSKIPNIEVVLQRGEKSVGGDEGDISINIYGTDYNKMISLSKEVTEIMKNSGYFRSIESSYRNPKKEINFIPNIENMTLYSAKNTEVGYVLRSSINGNDNNIYKENGEEYKINIELADNYKKDISDIEKINILSTKGMLPISELGKIEWKDASPNILRRDKIRIIQLDGFLSKSTTGQVQKILDKEFEKINFPEGYGYKYVGMDEYFVESTREISKAFLIASILTFMLLIAILNSFTLPFVIITSILTSFLGVIYFLFFFGYSINIGSLMAIIMLVGLAVNNAILMIDNTIQEAKHTKDLREALWNGTKGKFKTIIMTSFAIILGTLPQLTDANSAKASMGAVIIGGMVASIIFTLVLVPMIFEYVVKKFKVVF